MITLDEAIEILSRPKTMKSTPQDILEAHDMAITALRQPEIIHCRECKHWREDHTCREHSLVSPMMASEFCSRAERREESNESKERP